MENNLTLEILCSYLPHKTKIYDAVFEKSKELNPADLTRFIVVDGFDKSIKLLLRPMSDLTDDQIYQLDQMHDFSVMNFSQIKTDPMRYPYVIVQKLVEWKFDVFGGIKAGWALNLNEILK